MAEETNEPKFEAEELEDSKLEEASGGKAVLCCEGVCNSCESCDAAN